LYVVLGWFGLLAFFWCLLRVAARADRRDASARAQQAPSRDHPQPRDIRRVARTPRLLDRHALVDRRSAHDQPDESSSTTAVAGDEN
jgi:hypothetical protein